MERCELSPSQRRFVDRFEALARFNYERHTGFRMVGGLRLARYGGACGSLMMTWELRCPCGQTERAGMVHTWEHAQSLRSPDQELRDALGSALSGTASVEHLREDVAQGRFAAEMIEQCAWDGRIDLEGAC